MTMQERMKLKITPDVVKKQFHDAMERMKPVMAIDEEDLKLIQEIDREKERLVRYFTQIRKSGFADMLNDKR